MERAQGLSHQSQAVMAENIQLFKKIYCGSKTKEKNHDGPSSWQDVAGSINSSMIQRRASHGYFEGSTKRQELRSNNSVEDKR